MVDKGLGYAFLPGMILKGRNKLFNYEMTYKDGQPLTRKTWMLYNKEAMDLKLVKGFLSFMQSINIMEL